MYVYVAENLLNIWYIGEKHIKIYCILRVNHLVGWHGGCTF